MSRVTTYLKSIGRVASIATVLVVVVCATIVAIEVWNMAAARHAQIGEATAATTNLARSVAEMTTGTLIQSDLVLAEFVERLQTDGVALATSDRLRRLLSDRKGSLPQLQRIAILDADGRWIASDRAGAVERRVDRDAAYFRHHRDRDDVAPFLGPPIHEPSTNEWIVTVSRRFNDAHGRFAGVVLAQVALSYFNAYFDQFDLGRQGAITLVMSDGTVVDRRPFLDNIIASNVSDSPLFRDYIPFDDHGIAWITARFDHVERLVAYHRTDGFPMYAIAALSRKEILAPWISDVIMQACAALVFVALIAFVGRRLIRITAQRHRDQVLLLQSRSSLLCANARLEELAREDGLTGIPNRREFDRAIAEELMRASRRGGSIALLMIDIDHFKAYNDTYGHAQGDACLRRVAGLVGARASRPGDLAARYGGEEFVVLLPETDVAGARRVAEKLRAELHQAALPHGTSPKRIVTASIGVAAMKSTAAPFSALALIEKADGALYAAKRAGRDSIRGLDDGALGALPPAAWSPTQAPDFETATAP
jgi:diguanylate cyclase (GGDEF)-like protein